MEKGLSVSFGLGGFQGADLHSVVTAYRLRRGAVGCVVWGCIQNRLPTDPEASVLSATSISPKTSDRVFRKVSSSSDIDVSGVKRDLDISRVEKAVRWLSRNAGNVYE